MEIKGPERYDYKKPRRLNVVSFLLIVFALVFGYVAWKYGPVLWTGLYRVDQALDEVKAEASVLHRKGGLNDESKRSVMEKTVADGVARLHELGIEDYPDQPVQVWISPDLNYLQAKYKMVVHHLGGKNHNIIFNRNVRIPDEGTQF